AGGSPLILYFQYVGLPRTDFRAAMMSMFLVSSLTRVPAYGAAGLFDGPRFVSAALLAPAVVAGIVVGQKIHVGLNESVFRKVVLLGLAAIGVFLVVRYL
ncbi:MAG: TSUP family transporter, partial [Myxococcota bacterium]